MKKEILLLVFAIQVFVFTAGAQTESTLPINDSANISQKAPIEITDINHRLEMVVKYFQKMEPDLNPDIKYFQIDSTFQDYKTFLFKEAAEFRSYNPYNLSKYFLESSYRLWVGFNSKLTGWQAEVNSRIKEVQEDINSLDKIINDWELTLESEEYKAEPAEVKTRIKKLLVDASGYREDFRKIKRQYIILEDEIADMSAFCESITSEISFLQQNMRDSLFVANEKPIWQVKVTSSDYSPVSAKLNKFRHESSKTLKNYFQTQNMTYFWFALVIFLILFFYLRNKYLAKQFDNSLPGHKTIIRIFKGYPALTAISIALVSFHLSFPYYPLLLYHFITLFLLINMRFILSHFIEKPSRLFIFKLIVLLVINDLEIVFWYFGNISRFYILFETSLGLILTYTYLQPRYWKDFKTRSNTRKALGFLSIFVFVFYLIAFISNLYGYLSLAVLLVKVGIHLPEFTVLLYGLYLIAGAIIRSMVNLGRAGKENLMTPYWDSIEKWGIRITGILAVYFWFNSLTVSFEISRVIYDTIADFLQKERVIGTLQITIGSIVSMILILLGTFMVSGILKIFLEKILQKKTKLARGIPATISATIRYFIIILGVMFALSAAGIELGKFSLLAGALGVGIGFGLQNIVNNFISGLIIIYERPLQVGDTIEIEKLLGQVNSIGIRSSKVKTYDGAEVVVPNGNLISNQLINWTLSDNKRRIEIKVGVSYSSDPNKVLELLEKVASENADVLKLPPPAALFEDFGDSSLNFRLLFWVPYDIGMGTKSQVAIGIYNIFKENKIEIPFPQIDLNMKNPGKET